MPVGRQPLDAGEAFLRHVLHHLQRQGRDRPPAEVAQHDHRGAQGGDDGEGRPGGADVAAARRVDDAPGVERGEDFREGRQQHRSGAGDGQPWGSAPQAESESEHLAQHGRAQSRVGVIIVGHEKSNRADPRGPCVSNDQGNGSALSRKGRQRPWRPKTIGNPQAGVVLSIIVPSFSLEQLDASQVAGPDFDDNAFRRPDRTSVFQRSGRQRRPGATALNRRV